jgi:hypothetical protein
MSPKQYSILRLDSPLTEIGEQCIYKSDRNNHARCTRIAIHKKQGHHRQWQNAADTFTFGFDGLTAQEKSGHARTFARLSLCDQCGLRRTQEVQEAILEEREEMSARKTAWMQRTGRHQPASNIPPALPQNPMTGASANTQTQLPTTHHAAAAGAGITLGRATTTTNVATASSSVPSSRGGSREAQAYHTQQSGGGHGVPNSTAAAPNYPAIRFEPILTPRTYGAMHAITYDYEVDSESEEFETDQSDLNDHESDEFESDRNDLDDSNTDESDSNDDDSDTLDFEYQGNGLDDTTNTIPDMEEVDGPLAAPPETNIREMAMRDPSPIFARYGTS